MGHPLYFFFILALWASCSDTDTGQNPNNQYEILKSENPIPQGDRIIAIGVSEGRSGFLETFNQMQLAGVGSVELNLGWTYFETDQGVYQDPLGLLTAIQLYAENNIQLGLSLASINTVRTTHPTYLEGLPMNDPVYVAAFNDLMDWILERLPDNLQLSYISVGNEVDLFLNEENWPAFQDFLDETKDHLNAIIPGVPIGAKVTVVEGLYGDDREEVLEVIRSSDVAMLNYYPMNNRFEVMDPDVVISDFDRIVSDVSKPVFMTEIGYQSGNRFAMSSQEMQARFYHNMMNAWDTHQASIPLLQINWMHDKSQSELNDFQAFYGSMDPAFVEFLGTLGLRTYQEEDKLAYVQLLSDLEDRNWRN